jgi:hypothetical protein
MKLKIGKSMLSFFGACLFFISCHDNTISNGNKSIPVKPTDDSAAKIIMQTFGLPYPDNMKPDSNTLLFFCARSYDTSSLIYLQKNRNGIQGIFYMMLPAYHRFMVDYANEKSKLLFLEGYSFIIDSSIWKTITTQADTILAYKAKPGKHYKYVDGSEYGLFYNLQYSHGDSNNENVYEGFDKFLKNTFLEKFMQAKKPKMHKIK